MRAGTAHQRDCLRVFSTPNVEDYSPANLTLFAARSNVTQMEMRAVAAVRLHQEKCPLPAARKAFSRVARAWNALSAIVTEAWNRGDLLRIVSDQ